VQPSGAEDYSANESSDHFVISSSCNNEPYGVQQSSAKVSGRSKFAALQKGGFDRCQDPIRPEWPTEARHA
jgi:hypothetical protein